MRRELEEEKLVRGGKAAACREKEQISALLRLLSRGPAPHSPGKAVSVDPSGCELQVASAYSQSSRSELDAGTKITLLVPTYTITRVTYWSTSICSPCVYTTGVFK